MPPESLVLPAYDQQQNARFTQVLHATTYNCILAYQWLAYFLGAVCAYGLLCLYISIILEIRCQIFLPSAENQPCQEYYETFRLAATQERCKWLFV